MFNKLFGKKKLKPLSHELEKALYETIDWVYLHTVKELREGEYEGEPKDMPDEIQSAIIQRLFGATLAFEEDLAQEYQIDDWALDCRSKILSMSLSDGDANRVKLEYSRALGQVESQYTVCLLDGSNAARDFFNNKMNGQNPNQWLNSYEGMFLASIRQLINEN